MTWSQPSDDDEDDEEFKPWDVAIRDEHDAVVAADRIDFDIATAQHRFDHATRMIELETTWRDSDAIARRGGLWTLIPLWSSLGLSAWQREWVWAICTIGWIILGTWILWNYHQGFKRHDREIADWDRQRVIHERAIRLALERKNKYVRYGDVGAPFHVN